MLEVFILEYTLGKGRLEFAIEKKIHELGLGLDQEKTREKMSKDKTKEEDIPEETPPQYESFAEVAIGTNNNNNNNNNNNGIVTNRSSMESPAPPKLETPRLTSEDDDLQDLSQLTGTRFKLTKKKSRKTVKTSKIWKKFNFRNTKSKFKSMELASYYGKNTLSLNLLVSNKNIENL